MSIIETSDKECLYHVDGVHYMSPISYPTATISLRPDVSAIQQQIALTVIHVNSAHIALVGHQAILAPYLADDVGGPAWLETVYLVADQNNQNRLKLNEYEHLHSELVKVGAKVFLVDSNLLASDVPGDDEIFVNADSRPCRGPYLASRTSGSSIDSAQYTLATVYRLYSDTFRAFTFGVYPIGTGNGEYRALRRVDENGYNLIPTPSRLYKGLQVQGGKEELVGRRMAVKDLFDLNGVVTSAGSRAFGEFRGVARTSAGCVKQLEDLGITIVGKTKMAPFAGIASTNDDTVDEQYPWSPRGDGYQSSAASSSGSACAVAAYSWLDYAIGTDTGSSMRIPPALLGLYGNRPTTGTFDMTCPEIVPNFWFSDTAGVLARDSQAFTTLVRSWLAQSPCPATVQSHKRLSHRLIIPKAYIAQHTLAAQKVVDDFIRELSGSLHLDVEYIDLDGKFVKSGYDQAALQHIRQCLTKTCSWSSWKAVGQRFVAEYTVKQGRAPSLDPGPRKAWKTAQSLSNGVDSEWTGLNDMIKDIEQFGEWFNSEILEDIAHSGESNIFVYDIGTGGLPSYREEVLNDGTSAVNPFANHRDHTLPPRLFSAAGKFPEYVIPIGQVPYQSVISEREEMMPVTLSFAAHTGCDLVLLDFIDAMAKAGLAGEVKTGREAF